MNSEKSKEYNELEDLLESLEALPGEAEEEVAFADSDRSRQLRDPCLCESGKSFEDCHGDLTLAVY